MVYIFLATGFEDMEAIASIDILKRGKQEVETVSITGEYLVNSASGVKIHADILFESCDYMSADLLLLPGGGLGTENLSAHEGLAVALTEFAKTGKWIAAICAAPTVLGKLGLLINLKATCYPGCEDALKGATVVEDPVIVSKNIITGKGPGYSIPFALEVLRQLEDFDCAKKVATDLLIH